MATIPILVVLSQLVPFVSSCGVVWRFQRFLAQVGGQRFAFWQLRAMRECAENAAAEALGQEMYLDLRSDALRHIAFEQPRVRIVVLLAFIAFGLAWLLKRPGFFHIPTATCLITLCVAQVYAAVRDHQRLRDLFDQLQGSRQAIVDAKERLASVAAYLGGTTTFVGFGASLALGKYAALVAAPVAGRYVERSSADWLTKRLFGRVRAEVNSGFSEALTRVLRRQCLLVLALFFVVVLRAATT